MKNKFSFTNRVGILATMHRKERVIAPLLEAELEINVLVPENFNTDTFGTFTREIKRHGNQLEAARIKVKKALELTNQTLGFASEGTFGPHPAFPYISCNRELVILIDTVNDLEIVGQDFSTETNYNHKTIQSVEEAFDFAKQVGFPEHGLVVMTEPEAKNEIIKGITTNEQLADVVELLLKKSANGKVHIETDMRALYNPTRMKTIEKATRDLIKKVRQICPQCSCPGFAVRERKSGLPCALCSFPTSIALAAVYQCQKCKFSQEVLFPDGLEKADPSQCEYCNP